MWPSPKIHSYRTFVRRGVTRRRAPRADVDVEDEREGSERDRCEPIVLTGERTRSGEDGVARGTPSGIPRAVRVQRDAELGGELTLRECEDFARLAQREWSIAFSERHPPHIAIGTRRKGRFAR